MNDIISGNGLSIKELLGQEYDGAPNMAGIYKVVQAEILIVAPNAPYVHCADHEVNLALNYSVTVKNAITSCYKIILIKVSV